MPRNRMVKPDIWNDEKIGSMPESVALTFIGTWTFSDDYGVVRANPMWLKNQIYPYKAHLKVETFTSWLKILEENEMLIKLSFRGEVFYFIRTFMEHQTVDRPSQVTRNCSAEELSNALIDLGYTQQENRSWIKTGAEPSNEQSESPRDTLDEPSVMKYKYKHKDKYKDNRAKALVVSNETNDHTKEIRKKYDELIQSLTGKEVKDVWIGLRDFIRTDRPEFPEPYKEIWNILAEKHKLATVVTLSVTRAKKFAVRIKEDEFDFLQIMEKVKTSDTLRGLNGKWKVTFDFILENDNNYLKILGGNYD